MSGGGTTVQIYAVDVKFLAKRGATSQRGNSPSSRSAVLQRSLRTLQALLAESDPRKTGRLTEGQCRLAIRQLPTAWKLTEFEIKRLATYLQESPGLTAAAAELGIEVGPFLAAIDSLAPAEKIALVDQAVQEHAPQPAGRTSRPD